MRRYAIHTTTSYSPPSLVRRVLADSPQKQRSSDRATIDVTTSCSPFVADSRQRQRSSIPRTVVVGYLVLSPSQSVRRGLAAAPFSSIRRRPAPCPPPLRRDLPELSLDISMAPPAYVVRSVDDDCMASEFPVWPAISFSLQQEPVSSSSSSFAVSCEGFSSTRVRSFGCRIRTSSKHKDLGQNSGDEDLEREEEEEEEDREAGGVVQRMICAKEGAGEGLDDEGRGSSSATGGGGDGWEGASGISQTGGRSEASAGGAGGENRGPRDGKWFRISDSCSLALHRGDITKWFVDGKTDAIVNAANEAMLGGGGVDGAIHSAAGPELYAACYAVPEVTRGVRCPTGSAVITGGFNLPASKVIHTVGPIYSSDEVSAEPLAKAYRYYFFESTIA
jgi:hypothetical protein